MKHNGFLEEIGQQLYIYKDISESEEEWKSRIIYSATGKIALASLWDHGEDDGPNASVQHIKKSIQCSFYAYHTLYPEAKRLFAVDLEELIQEMYEIYSLSGNFYHSPYWASPAANATSICKGVCFERGAAPGKIGFMSGLGTYTISQEAGAGTAEHVTTMFRLQKESLTVWFQKLLKNQKWAEIEFPQGTEFLRMQPPFSRGYWDEHLNKTGEISLARYGQAGRYLYILYRCEDGIYIHTPLPHWRTETGGSRMEYLRIASAILASNGQLPPIRVKVGQEMARIRLDYLLPPTEETFFKLYSWPVSFYKSPQNFQRAMTVPVYRAFKTILEQVGYEFMEES